MSGSKYLLAADGLLARGSGRWAQEKLHFVAGYMEIFSKGMKLKWESRAYIDLMAGPGLCVVDDGSGEEFDGSPLLALKIEPAFTHVVLVEAEPGLYDLLTQRTTAFTTPAPVRINGDCNDADVIRRVREAVPSNALGLAFADMVGLEVALSTLEQLSRNRRLDLLITLQLGDFNRNGGLAASDPALGVRWDAFFGSTDWRDVVGRYYAGDRRGRDLASALSDFYEERLRSIGYTEFTELRQRMKNQKNAPLYRVVLAAKHERARDFFDKISSISYDGTRRLF